MAHYHHKPQLVRIGDHEGDTKVVYIKKPESFNPPFNFDQLLDEVNTRDLQRMTSEELLARCKQGARILKLPARFQDLNLKNKKGTGVSTQTQVSDLEEVRKLIRKSNSRILAAKQQCRPIQKGLPIGYWRHSKNPLRYAVHATRMSLRGRLMLQLADTNENGIYQAPLPLGIFRPILWKDVILLPRFDSMDPVERNNKITVAIQEEVWAY